MYNFSLVTAERVCSLSILYVGTRKNFTSLLQMQIEANVEGMGNAVNAKGSSMAYTDTPLI